MAGIGTADTSVIIKAKTSATRPARERKLEYMIVGPADRKMERERTSDFYKDFFYRAWLLEGCVYTELRPTRYT